MLSLSLNRKEQGGGFFSGGVGKGFDFCQMERDGPKCRV